MFSSCKTQEIDGFENLPIKIDGFGRTHRTHTNGAPGKYEKILTKLMLILMQKDTTFIIASVVALAWVRWVRPNPSIFGEGFSNPSIFGKIQYEYKENSGFDIKRQKFTMLNGVSNPSIRNPNATTD